MPAFESRRFGLMPKDVLRRPDGSWRCYDDLIVEICARPGVTRYQLCRGTGLLPAEVDTIVDRLQVQGKVERNRRLTGGRPIDRYEAPGRGDIFWGAPRNFHTSHHPPPLDCPAVENVEIRRSS